MNHFRQPPTVLWHWGSMTADDDSGNQDAYDQNAPPLGGGRSQQFTLFCVAAEKCKNESNSRIGEKVKNGVAPYAVPMQNKNNCTANRTNSVPASINCIGNRGTPIGVNPTVL